ncbi:protein VACUOLELESS GAMETOPHYTES-like [Alnus glutinosa]|uniref:protein VACUOLELESS GAMETOPHYTES-like n=1 Tax=Alnus glutinosa TaxID=3517 RepID=UPI002D764C74|nr:protein VACUOLELESS GAMETOPHYTES-like [Alnus glutinosa]
MEVQHFSHEEHPLIFVEELENDGENEVVCSGCDKSVCGPAYKCSEYCTFFLHKSCAELPREIQHPAHPNHNLVLVAPAKYKTCDACLRRCNRCLAYRCHSCNFDLDIECASGWQVNADDGHQHEFVPIMKKIQLDCEVCGQDRNSFPQVCRICQLLAHTICAVMPRTMKIMADRHLLTLIYSLRKVIKGHDDVFCNLCFTKLNLNCAGYYCQQCDFVAHVRCARKNSIEPSDTLDFSIDLMEDINFEEDEECDELKHFDHEHNLIISRNQVEVHDHKLCEGCIIVCNQFPLHFIVVSNASTFSIALVLDYP